MSLINFFYEIGDLKRIARSGWWSAKIQRPETVAEHSFRAAIIAYCLAEEEGKIMGRGKDERDAMGEGVTACLKGRKGELANVGELLNPEHVAFLALFHDVHEARILDLHKVSKAYVKANEAKAKRDQLKGLPETLRKKIGSKPNAKEAEIIRDADLLELALTAHEYESVGYRETRTWLERAGEKLKTRTAKKWFEEIKNTEPSKWYGEFRGN
ncbi:HD domain-containing protein [Candidatus Micrarchaeota archaeon]|nr:HD domain-containing protein [Candidatus Micrarchaeota archaeon]